MRIYTYRSDDPDAPEGLACAATLVLPQQVFGKRVTTPTWVAHGATPEEARAKLEKLWADMQPAPPRPKKAPGP